MATGTVLWFNPIRGVGFIQPDDGRRTVVCLVQPQSRPWLDSLSKGSKVIFDYGVGKDGKLPCADHLELLE
ncbi:MAG: cold shock domain-containing protein [Anaerolineae bacterium]